MRLEDQQNIRQKCLEHVPPEIANFEFCDEVDFGRETQCIDVENSFVAICSADPRPTLLHLFGDLVGGGQFARAGLWLDTDGMREEAEYATLRYNHERALFLTIAEKDGVHAYAFEQDTETVTRWLTKHVPASDARERVLAQLRRATCLVYCELPRSSGHRELCLSLASKLLDSLKERWGLELYARQGALHDANGPVVECLNWI